MDFVHRLHRFGHARRCSPSSTSTGTLPTSSSMYAHPASIAQPPHTAGKSLQGPRARISPDQIPSPVEVAENDEEAWDGKSFTTLPGSHVPLSTTDFVSIDQGNSNPRFIRPTTWNIPNSSDLAESCQVPMAAVIQPFADLRPEEEPVPVVYCEDDSLPARCEMCRGYVNPWCTWLSGGSSWRCNLCAYQNHVSPEYFCGVDANQVRLDYYERPELSKGTVDFEVTSAYYAAHPPPRMNPSYFVPGETSTSSSSRTPSSLRVLFVIDVSADAIQCGFTKAACTAIKGVLFGGETESGIRMEPCFPACCRAGILTFNNAIHYYDISPNRDDAAMLIVPDIEDEMYCPMMDGLFVDPQPSRNILENLLNSIPERFALTPGPAATGAALRGCLASLAREGGHVLLFQSSPCQAGPGAIRVIPEETKLYNTDKEKQLFVPHDPSWRELGEECAEEGIGVTMFLGNSSLSYMDIASIGIVPLLTGGELHHYPRFDPMRDFRPICTELQRVLTRTTGYNAQARVRCSTGLHIRAHHGAFHQRNPTDLELGIVHADAAFSLSLEHSNTSSLMRKATLDEREYAYLQCAVLYTTIDGRRRVRVLNLALQVSALAGNVFRYADTDATVCHLAKEAMSSLPFRTLTEIRESLTEKCASILLAYRRNCAAATSPSQLILPDGFKLLPVYTLTIHKNRSLRAHNVTSDLRNAHAYRILSSPVHILLRNLYPRFMALHDLTDEIALPPPKEAGREHGDNESAPIHMPSLMRTSYTGMRADGLYLIDNEVLSILWVGSRVRPEVLQDLFAVNAVHDINPKMTNLPSLPTRLSTQVRNILLHRSTERHGVETPLLIARQNMDGAEVELSDMLVEDQNCGTMSYIDYLCFVHKQINVALTNNTSVAGAASYGLRGTPW